MLSSVTRLDVAFAVVEPLAPYKPPSLDSFDRIPDPTVLKLRVAALVSLDVVSAALQNTLDQMRLAKEMYTLDGEPLAKNFTIRLAGATQLADRPRVEGSVGC